MAKLSREINAAASSTPRTETGCDPIPQGHSSNGTEGGGGRKEGARLAAREQLKRRMGFGIGFGL